VSTTDNVDKKILRPRDHPVRTFIRVWYILIMCLWAMGATTRDLGPGAPEDGAGGGLDGRNIAVFKWCHVVENNP